MRALTTHLATALGVTIALWAAYAYLLRFERRVISRLPLQGSPRWGILWPLVDAWRSLTKRPSLLRRGRGAVLAMGPLLTYGCALLGLLSVPWTPPSGASAMLAVGSSLAGHSLLLALWSSVGSLLGTALFGWAVTDQAPASHSQVVVRRALLFWLPAVLALAGVVLLSSSLDVGRIVETQIRSLPYLVYQPLGLIVFGLSVCAAGRRMPIVLPPNARPALSDFCLQHAGHPFALYHLSEYMHLLLGSALIATLFCAGWWGPWRHGAYWLIAKMVPIMAALIWLRAKWFVRLDADQWRALWVRLVSLSLGNLLLTALVLMARSL